jgi:ABC-type multidrug transport system fused ATPase/permease subunit
MHYALYTHSILTLYPLYTHCAISIAHRLTTIKDSDKIVVIKDGNTVESGTHQELLAIPVEKGPKTGEKDPQETLKGIYADLWKTQMGEDESGEDK